MPPAPIQKWWVVTRTSGARGGPPVKMAVSGLNRPNGAIAGPFRSQQAAMNDIKGINAKANNLSGGGINLPNPVAAVQGWFGGLGGMIGSGIEAGFIQSVKDIWDVIIGPLEVILGFIVAAFVLVVYFKDDIVSGIAMAAKIFAVAGA